MKDAFNLQLTDEDDERRKRIAAAPAEKPSTFKSLMSSLAAVGTPVGQAVLGQRFYDAFVEGRKTRKAGKALETAIQPVFQGARPGPQTGISAGRFRELQRQGETEEEIQDRELQRMVDLSRELEGHDTSEFEQAIADGDFTGLIRSILKDPVGVLGEEAARSFGTAPEGIFLGALGPFGQFFGAVEPERQVDLAENFKAELQERGEELTVENLKSLLQEPETVEALREGAGQRAAALATTEAIFGFGLGKVVEKAGSPFVKAFLGLTTEAAGESVGELAGQATEGEIRPLEVFAEGLAAGPQSLVAVGAELAFDNAAARSEAVRPIVRFVQKQEEAGLTREEAEANATLWAARAAQLGLDVDSFFNASVEDVEVGGPAQVTPEALQQIPEGMWFSQLETELRRSGLPNTATNKEYRKIISALQKKGKFKEDELYWSGLPEYLDLMDEMGQQVDRDDIFALLNFSRVRVTEQVLTSKGFDLGAVSPVNENIASRLNEIKDDFLVGIVPEGVDPNGEQAERFFAKTLERLNGDTVNLEKVSQDLADALDRNPNLPGMVVREIRDLIQERQFELLDSGGSSIYERYQIPGGKNYREILITLPSLTSPQDRVRGFVDEPRQAPFNRDLVYTGGHWGQHHDNVLLHMRVDDRTLSDGRRVLFLQEMQSDPHQGRRSALNEFVDAADDISFGSSQDVLDVLAEKGYSSLPSNRKDVTVDFARNFFIALRDASEYDEPLVTKGEEGGFRVETPDGRVFVSSEDAKNENEAAAVVLRSYLPPDMPFEATDSWTSLGIKRLLRYAVDNGYDSVSWSDASSIATAVGGSEVTLSEHYMRRLPKLFQKLSKEKARLEELRVNTRKAEIGINESLNIIAHLQRVTEDPLNRNRSIEGIISIMDDTRNGALIDETIDSYISGELSYTDTKNKLFDIVGASRALTKKFGTIDVTPKLKERVLGGLPLFQGAKGAVTFTEEGKALVQLFDEADVSTVLHESAHIWRRGLTAEEQREADALFGVGEEGWTREHEEAFARHMEAWAATGKAESSRMTNVLKKFGAWLKTIYNGIVGSSIDVNLTPEMKAFFEGMFADPTAAIPTGPPRGAQLSFGSGPQTLLQEEPELPEGLPPEMFEGFGLDEDLFGWADSLDETTEDFPRVENFFEALGTPTEEEFQSRTEEVPLSMEEEQFLSEVLGIVALDRRAAEAFIRRVGLTADTSQRRQSWLQAIARAHAEGLTNPITAEALVASILASPRPVRDVDYAAMLLNAVFLDQQKDTKEDRLVDLIERGGDGTEADILRQEIQKINGQRAALSQASVYVGSETGRALAIRQLGVDRREFSPVRVIRQATILKGEKLTDKERQYYQDTADELIDLNESIVSDVERAREAAERVSKTRAEKIARRITLVQSDKEELRREREIIKRALNESGYQFNANLLIPSPRDLYNMGLYAKNLIKTLGLSAEEAALQTMQTFPGWLLEPFDIYQGIVMQGPGKPTKKRQRKQISKAEAHLRGQKKKARLLIEIEKLERGLIPRSRTVEMRSDDPEIKALRKKLRDLKREYYTDDPTFTPEAWIDNIEKINSMLEELGDYEDTPGLVTPGNMLDLLADLKKNMAIQADIDSLSQAIKNIKDGKPVQREDVFPPRKPVARSQSLTKRMRRKAQLSTELRRKFEELSPKSSGEKILYWARGVNGLARAAKASLDLSGTFLQGGFLLVRHPLISGRAFAAQVMAGYTAFIGGSPEAYMAALLSNDDKLSIWKEAGLEITDIHGDMLQQEEFFSTHILDKWRNHENKWFRGAGIALTQHIHASGAAMTTFLNYQRAGVFEAWYQAHKTHPDFTMDDARLAAAFINSATGRGLVKKTQLTLAADLLFAPKWYKSRFDLLNPAFYTAHTNKQTRGLIASSAASYIMSRMGLLYLFGMAGSAFGIDVSIGTDPREADWGKLVIGKTRIDVWAGMQQMARLAIAGMYGLGDMLGIIELEPQREVDYRAELGRFFSYKAAPLPAATLSAFSGKNAVGEPRGLGLPISENIIIQDMMIPIPASEFFSAAKEIGPLGAMGSFAVSAVGIPTGTYGTELETPVVQQIINYAKYNPGPPRYPERVRQNKRTKDELDTIFGDNLGKRIKDNKEYLLSLSQPGAEKVLRKYAEIERKRMIGPMYQKLSEQR